VTDILAAVQTFGRTQQTGYGQKVIGLIGPLNGVTWVNNEYILALGKSLSDISNVLRQVAHFPDAMMAQTGSASVRGRCEYFVSETLSKGGVLARFAKKRKRNFFSIVWRWSAEGSVRFL
jgi:hypothetical protein